MSVHDGLMRKLLADVNVLRTFATSSDIVSPLDGTVERYLSRRLAGRLRCAPVSIHIPVQVIPRRRRRSVGELELQVAHQIFHEVMKSREVIQSGVCTELCKLTHSIGDIKLHPCGDVLDPHDKREVLRSPHPELMLYQLS